MKVLTAVNELRFKELVSLLLLCITAITLVGLQRQDIGWSVFLIGTTWLLLWTKGDFRRHISLVYVSLGLLGLVPITTDTSNENFLRMGSVLGLALILPYLVTRYLYKDNAVTFRWHHGRRWLRPEVYYILITALGSYLLLPFYLKNSGAYLNWAVENNTESIARLFVGTNLLGIWDELFFVSTVLGLLRKHLSFKYANIVQATLFTSFLYELGFTGWGPVAIFPFALSQGLIFKKTDSLLYVITIHLTLDLVLFLALLNAHHPELANVFIV